MTKAICWKCGEFKDGGFNECKKCNAIPNTEDELITSLFLTDHYQDDEGLKQLQEKIKGGSQFVIPDELREQMRPELQNIQRMLGIGNSNSSKVIARKGQPSKDDVRKIIKRKLLKNTIFNIISVILIIFLAPLISFYSVLLFTSIFSLIQKIIPLGSVFGNTYYVLKDFALGLVLSYSLFWSSFKFPHRGIKKKWILSILLVLLLDILIEQFNIRIIGIYQIGYISNYYAALLGALLVAYACFSGKLQYLIPKSVLNRKHYTNESLRDDIDREIMKIYPDYTKENDPILNTKDTEQTPSNNLDVVFELVKRAKERTDKNDIQGAIEDLEHALELDSRIKSIHLMLARLYAKNFNHEDAIDAALEALEDLDMDDKDKIEMYKIKGISNQRLGDKSAAILDYSKMIDIDPTNEDARKLLDAVKRKQKDS